MLNAIAHKNYASLIPIQIQVFPDKMIISNDCVFPEDWTMEDFLGKHRSRPYNPLIANTFYRAGFIESWGRGIMKILEACKNTGNKEPVYRIKSDELTVVFEANVVFAASNDVFDQQKGLFEERIELFENRIEELSIYRSSKENLLKIFVEFFDVECFGRQDIVAICKVNANSAGKLIDKLKECRAIESVNGHGKGKYRFIV